MSSGREKKRFWLAKIPNWILDDWKKDTDPGHTLGYISIDPNKKVGKYQQMRMHLTSQNPDIPKELRITVRDKTPKMMVFTNRAEKLKIEGGVEVTCDVKPFDNAEYRNLLMRRHRKATTKTAVIKRLLGGPINSTSTNRTSTISRIALPERRPSERYTPKPKRARMDRKALEYLLFRLFDKKMHYNINELVALTDQPKAFLKNVLGDICDHHKTGNYIHHYSLKAKYQTNGDTGFAT